MNICVPLGSRRSRVYFALLVVFVLVLSLASPESRAQGATASQVPTLGLTCSSSSSSIYPGDLVTVTGTVAGFTEEQAKDRLLFKWSGDPQIAGSDPAVTFTPQSPGETTIHGKVTLKSDPSKFGECDVRLSVTAFEPPTVSCSASPSVVNPGDSSSITASASSPTNRPLTYSYSATNGTISGNTSTATLSTAGSLGQITISCNVIDDKGQSASSTTSVTVNIPTPPPPPPVGLPPFPWPPPAVSARITIPMTLGRTGLKKMGDVDRKIISALTSKGYVERAHYWVPNGYVLITRVEQIDKNGVAEPEPYRFSDELPPPDSISTYIGGLLTSRVGYFRIIAFVVTNVPFNTGQDPLNEADAVALLHGPAALPAAFAANPVPKEAEVTALIYEYQKATVNPDTPAVAIYSPVSAQKHLEQAGLWQLLTNP